MDYFVITPAIMRPSTDWRVALINWLIRLLAVKVNVIRHVDRECDVETNGHSTSHICRLKASKFSYWPFFRSLFTSLYTYFLLCLSFKVSDKQ